MTLRLGDRPLPLVGRARIYVCGITPYDTTHLGHAATFVWTDVVVRLLRHVGLQVDLCRNITDVDDDMVDQARARGVPWRSLATQQTYRFEEDMRLLGVSKPTFEPQSHSYVDEVVALAGALLQLDAAYGRGGSVWFRAGEVASRAGLDRDGALALASERGGRTHEPGDPARPSPDDPLDVAVWQASLEGEPSWPSPWGDGRPGWHAECAAMALATLGAGIDLHGGGADLAFPHHAYEAALAEAVTGVSPFSRSWLHVGTVMIGGRKMAKSSGNLIFVHQLLADWPAAAVRLLILDRGWAEPWEYREHDLVAAADRFDRLRSAAGRPGDDATAERAAVDALLDDLDVGSALAMAEESGGQVARTVGQVLGVL